MPISPHLRARLPLSVLVLVLAVLGVAVPGSPVFASLAQAQQRATGPPGAENVSPSLHAKQLLVRGMTRAYVDDYEGAIAYYEQALELRPNEAAILDALAEAHAAAENPTTALFYAEKAREATPDNPYYAQQLGNLQRDTGQPEAAADTYRALIDRFPKHTPAYEALAALQSDAGRPRAAANTYEALLDAGAPVPEDVYPRLLQLYQELDDEAGMETALEALVDLRPGSVVYTKLLANLYAKQNRVEPAIALYRDLVEQRPRDLSARMRLATLYRQAGQPDRADAVVLAVREEDASSPDELASRASTLVHSAQRDDDPSLTVSAVDLLQRALDTDAAHEPSLVLLGEIRYQRGDFAEAGALLERALQQNPRAPKRWTLAASAYLRGHQPEKAFRVAEEGLLLFPGRESLLKVAGDATFALDRYDEAVRYYEDVFAIMADDGDGQTMEGARLQARLGRAHHRAGRPADATSALETALASAPDAPLPAAATALVLADRDTDLDRARTLADRAAAAAPDDPTVLHALGWVAYRQGRLQDARTHFDAALDTGEASALMYERAGDVAQAQGDTRAATRYWKTAQDRAPHRTRLQDKLSAPPR